VYQVSITAFDCGRNIPKSKRCIRWRFGFPDKEANGTHCRGEEHEVTLIWSITSGKRVIKVDGDQIHSSQGKRSEKLKYSWKWEDIDLEIVAYAAPPIRAREGFCLNDLIINGKRFHCLGAICDIGSEENDNDDVFLEPDALRGPGPASTKQKDEEQSAAECKDDSKIKESADDDDSSEVSYSSSDNGLLSNEHLCSHDLKTDDINPNEPPCFEDFELESTGAARIEQSTLSYEQAWGTLANDGNGKGNTTQQQPNKRSPTSVRNFGVHRKLPNRRAKRNLSVCFEKLKLSSPSLGKSPERTNRNLSSYKELDV